MAENVTFRYAQREDVPLIMEFVRALAEYEKMPDLVCAAEKDLEEWLFDKMIPVENRLTAEDIKAGNALALLEMIATGTTSYSDMYFEPQTAVENALACGIKASKASTWGRQFSATYQGCSPRAHVTGEPLHRPAPPSAPPPATSPAAPRAATSSGPTVLETAKTRTSEASRPTRSQAAAMRASISARRRARNAR